ncbi:hypothetical protein Syun_009587 [Stephania yunnanensis]|uniref:Uncharacterized protein n=1 Tax=Stephania yunnanensis TaxID=152371 RepID=A0AAP0KGE7_9MAGN
MKNPISIILYFIDFTFGHGLANVGCGPNYISKFLVSGHICLLFYFISICVLLFISWLQ